MDNCIFCKIAKGEIPCHKIYEDEEFLAFLDINPYVTGHTLLIPKKHYRWVWDLENYSKYMDLLKKIVKHYQEVTGKEMVYSTIFGEEVPHAHIHILPVLNKEDFDFAFSGLRRKSSLRNDEASDLIRLLSVN